MIIYKITNKINGKIYIGQTKNILGKRWSQHKDAAFKRNFNMPLHFAIKKYGSENFIIEEIAKANNVNDLNILEIELISKYNSTNPKIGYNICKGGNNRIDGNSWSEERKRQASERIKGNKNPRYRIKHTKEFKKYLSEINSGNKNKMYGKTHSKEARQKIGEKHCKRVKAINVKTGEELIFDSITKAANYFGVIISVITYSLRIKNKYKRSQTQGHYWEYIIS